MNTTLFFDMSGRLMLSQTVQGPNSHFPHHETIDLTKHIEDCVRRVLEETRPCQHEYVRTALATGLNAPLVDQCRKCGSQVGVDLSANAQNGRPFGIQNE